MRLPPLAVPLALVTACAPTLHPPPPSAAPAERLQLAEEALTSTHSLSLAFDVHSAGAHTSNVHGTLDLHGDNALQLLADGTFDGEPVHLELDSRTGELIRSATKGASASSHREPLPTALGEAVTVALARQGLLHNVAMLVSDEPVDHAQGGAREWLLNLEPKAAGEAKIEGEPCHLVGYGLSVKGERVGDGTLCLSDGTALPLERKLTVRFEKGEMQVTERYKWKVR